MLWVHVLFVGLLVGTEAFFTALAVLNRRHAATAVRENEGWLRGTLDVEDPDRLLDYDLATTGLSLVESWVTLGFVLLIVYGGPLERIVATLEATTFGHVIRGILFFLLAVVAARLKAVPFDAANTFVVEELFDFNRQTPRLWIRDRLVGLAIGLAIVAPIGAAVLAFLRAFPTTWWLAAWGLFVAFSVAMLVVYPRVIAPLFNDFEPVEGGPLYEAVTDVFERAGFTCERIYVMDASRRSSHSNAYFVGFGRTKRVVLFDTLVERMELPEIESVLAHELAHWKRAHVWKRLASSALVLGVAFGALHVLVSAEWLYAAFDLPRSAAYAGLLLGALVVGQLRRLLAPLENRISLAHEREADRFAVDVMGEGESLVDALCRLTGENLANPFPHPLYATFHYTHPPIPERIRRIRAESGDADGASEA